MMIQQLRKKFIVVAMCSMIAVLAVIVGSLNVASYCSLVERADRILHMLADNDGRFPDNYPGRKQSAETEDKREEQNRRLQPSDAFKGLSAETPYDTRFFSVLLSQKGEAVSVDTGRIAAVQTQEAITYAQTIWSGGQEKGFWQTYRFLRQQTEDSSECRIIFVDCGNELSSFRTLALSSLGMSLLGIAAVFVLVMIFSRRVFIPVEESYARQKQFVTDASHELKTPLTIISANVDILEMEGQENQWTASIRNQVKRLRKLTEQMVTLSRMEEEDKLQLAECSLADLAAEAAALFAPLAKAQDKKLTLDIQEVPACRGDEEKLRQMLSLLLDNALKYTPEQGEICLKLEPAKKAGRARITLWNTVGEESGITPGRQDMLFERFYRPDASRSSKTGGSGIGLSIVKTIVERHHGKISAMSEDGHSIRFVIEM
jgi:signal transduction histidine kinase